MAAGTGWRFLMTYALLSRPSSCWIVSQSKTGMRRLPSVWRRFAHQTEESTSTAAVGVSPQVGMGRWLGGDYCGLSATFSATDGKLIRVPSHLVPESMLEWGQVPACLEVIVSEHLDDDEDEKPNTAAVVLNRQTVTIYPEVGCGVDNLETSKKEESHVLQHGEPSSSLGGEASAIGLSYDLVPPGSRKNDNSGRQTTTTTTTRTETVFAGFRKHHRLRVLIDLLRQSPCSWEIQSPIVVVMEHQTSSVSSGGTIADGGGLDGQTVARLMGEYLRAGQNNFAEQDALPLDATTPTDLQSLSLPGNITVSYGAETEKEDSFVLQVAYQPEQGEPQVVERIFKALQS